MWKGSVEKYEKKLDEKVRELIKEINTIAEQENEIYGDKDLEELCILSKNSRLIRSGVQ